MKTLVKSLLSFCEQTLLFVGFLLRLLYHRAFSNPFKTRYEGTVAVLANGPSLKEVISRVQTDEEFQGVDFIVMNYFALDPIFTQIKPKHYCLADPMFFQKSNRYEEVRKLFSVLQEVVNWNMTIYIPHLNHDFLKFSALTNSYIQIRPINAVYFRGYPMFKDYFYRRGLSMPVVGTVVHLAIYVAINSGYTEIHLYGVDHTFFNTLCVNDKNELCHCYSHFYGESELVPVHGCLDSKPQKIADYLKEMSILFNSHDELAHYAENQGVKIINYTDNSMIDSYVRRCMLINND